MTNETNLLQIVSKLQQFDGRVWCGYLTPAEIVLVNKKCGGTLIKLHDFILAKRSLARGDSNPRWFYFRPAGEMMKVLGIKQDDRVEKSHS